MAIKDLLDHDELPLAVRVARETLGMYRELEDLRDEVKELREYRRKYMELIQQGIDHSRQVIGGILKIATTPGVMEAIDAHNQQKG